MISLKPPYRAEIDQHTMKLTVGFIAFLLPIFTSIATHGTIASISASYWQGGLTQTIFVGFLSAIAAIMFSYNGTTGWQRFFSKVASIAALCVALFPCGCCGQEGSFPHVHTASAAVMFLVLAFFCCSFFGESRGKSGYQPKARMVIYAICLVGNAAAIIILGLDAYADTCSDPANRAVFWGEAAGLWSFGISWMTASHVAPWLATKDERFHLLGTA
jgi:hypothetical protein